MFAMKTRVICAILMWGHLAAWPQVSKPLPPSQSSAAPSETRVPIGGAELYARDIGQGTAIIVLHGGPDFDHSYLLPELDRLSDSFRLIYYDQRGRGRSAAGVKPEDVTLVSDLEDIDKVRQYFHLDSVVLLGHSWGTLLALEYALRYPQHVSRLILVNPAPASAADYQQLRKEWLEKRADAVEGKKAIAAGPEYKEGDPAAVTAYYRIHFKPAFARSENYEKFLTRLSASFTKEGILKARAIENRLEGETWLSPNYDPLLKLKSLTVPALVISGDHEFIPASTAEHISQAIPKAHLVVLKDCGHFTYMECPAAFREQIDAFFR